MISDYPKINLAAANRGESMKNRKKKTDFNPIILIPKIVNNIISGVSQL